MIVPQPVGDDEIKTKVRRFWDQHATATQARPTFDEPAQLVAYAPGYGQGSQALPADLLASSWGCGNTLAHLVLGEGECAVDVGCGAGLDAILLGRRVGGSGLVVGLDLSPEMIALAKRHAREAGTPQVVLVLADAGHIPLRDSCADGVASNSALYMVPNRLKALAEAYRVLRPGCILSIADAMSRGEIPSRLRRDPDKWVGWYAGAQSDATYPALLVQAGFEQVALYRCGEDPPDGTIYSAVIVARKPHNH